MQMFYEFSRPPEDPPHLNHPSSTKYVYSTTLVYFALAYPPNVHHLGLPTPPPGAAWSRLPKTQETLPELSVDWREKLPMASQKACEPRSRKKIYNLDQRGGLFVFFWCFVFLLGCFLCVCVFVGGCFSVVRFFALWVVLT